MKAFDIIKEAKQDYIIEKNPKQQFIDRNRKIELQISAKIQQKAITPQLRKPKVHLIHSKSPSIHIINSQIKSTITINIESQENESQIRKTEKGYFNFFNRNNNQSKLIDDQRNQIQNQQQWQRKSNRRKVLDIKRPQPLNIQQNRFLHSRVHMKKTFSQSQKQQKQSYQQKQSHQQKQVLQESDVRQVKILQNNHYNDNHDIYDDSVEDSNRSGDLNRRFNSQQIRKQSHIHFQQNQQKGRLSQNKNSMSHYSQKNQRSQKNQKNQKQSKDHSQKQKSEPKEQDIGFFGKLRHFFQSLGKSSSQQANDSNNKQNLGQPQQINEQILHSEIINKNHNIKGLEESAVSQYKSNLNLNKSQFKKQPLQVSIVEKYEEHY